jgi:dipeptidyl aminopeptidase/acylaminoacyl peptidase
LSKRLLTAEDIRRFQLVSNPLYSPDGQWVIYEQQVTDEAADSYEVQLMIVAAAGGVPRQLTTVGSRNRHAAWSPDGRYVAFVSNRTHAHQLWLLPMHGGDRTHRRTFRSPTEAMREMVVPFYPTSEIHLDDSNRGLFDEIELVEPEPFYYNSQDDWRIQGWVMNRLGFEKVKHIR